MTRDTRNNLIIATLAISLVAHLVAMFWVKPKVMTRVTSGIARLVRHGPMHVTKANLKPDPIAIEVVRDEKAKKEAPKAEETVAILPSEETALPSSPVRTALPDTATPDVLSRLTPDETAPHLASAIPVVPVPPATMQRMEFDKPHMADVTAPSVGLSVPDGLPVVPVFEASVFAPVGHFKESVAEIARIDKPETVPKKEFKPIEEVMPKVDERVVQAEKDAVRDLMNSADFFDMHNAVDVTLSTCLHGSWTYFKVSVQPKSRLPSVPKDVVILIDASGSIGYDRLLSCRKAAQEILRTAMNTGDRFNLVAFRDKFAYAFKSWRPCDAPSYAAGDKWMTRLAAHGRTDVFASISSVLTLPRDPTRPLVALVVTDGEANTGVSETSDILAQFSKLNDGLVSVYMYGVKSSANRELIDVLTHGNRGESFIFDGWRWKAGEGISAFSERFRDPIITDLRFVFTSNCAAEAYPVLLKNLYCGRSVELFGRLPGKPTEIVFSLRGLAGSVSYDGLFRLPIALAKTDRELPSAWFAERALNEKLR